MESGTNIQIYVKKNTMCGLEEHIKDIDLTALSIDVMQNLSVMSYEKSSDFYEGEVQILHGERAFDILIEEEWHFDR